MSDIQRKDAHNPHGTHLHLLPSAHIIEGPTLSQMLIGFGIAGRGSLGIWHWRSTLILLLLEDARVETANEGLFSSHLGGKDRKAIDNCAHIIGNG